MDYQEIKNLEKTANDVRKEIITMIHRGGKGHPGGSLSAVEFTVACYFHAMRYQVENPKWEKRDRFILSKGHASSVQYATMAYKGIIPFEVLETYGDFSSILQGHPDCKKCPGIEISTGSLGQGLACGVGMALASKMDEMDYDVYVCVGDGECNEGEIWESLQTATKYELDNLIVFVDKNGLQGDGDVEEIMPPLDLKKKMEAFGFAAKEINGNDMQAVVEAIDECKANRNGKPKAIIGFTIKGKGVSFMENNPSFHGKAPNDEEYKIAMEELQQREAIYEKNISH